MRFYRILFLYLCNYTNMHHILTPGHIGVVSLVVSLIYLLKKFAISKIRFLSRKFYFLFLKVRAYARNHIYVWSHKIAFRFHKSNVRTILFSEKEEWDEIIGESFKGSPFKLNFRAFEPADFKSYDLVIPLSINDLKVCIDNRDKLPAQAIGIPTAESMEICNDKHRFNTFMINNGFRAYIPNVEKPFRYPYMLKKSIDEYGCSTFIIEGPQDELMHFHDLRDADFYCQELIPGKYEYATHINFRDGRILSALNIRYTFEHDRYIKGKEFYICREVYASAHLDLFADILQKIGYEGICCFNYKETDGKPMIFEINPRFGGSLTDYFFTFIRKLK